MEEDRGAKKLRRGPWGYVVAGAVAAALSVGLFAGSQYFYERMTAGKESAPLDNPVQAEVKPEAVSELKKTSEGFRAVARMVGPAVVKIQATKGAPPKASRRGMPPGMGGGPGGRGGQGMPDEGGRDPFFDFFERFGNPFPYGGQQPDVQQESLGSGVIIDKRGYVVTNNHVVEGATKIVVVLPDKKDAEDGTELKAKVIGTDPKTDLAVLKVESKTDLPSVEWEDSKNVEVGDWAIAIGSPFSLSRSVTVGIVSAKGRSSRVIGADYAELIQTDAAINPGNSGGPLCTLTGKVMGINTAIYTRSGGYMGIGFAIPSTVAKEITDKLISDGKIIRGWLGVYIQPIDDVLAGELGIKSGVAVHAAMEGSPAEKAGLLAGDVIIEVDGKKIEDVNQLQRFIAAFKPGQKVRIKVISLNQGKATRNLTVKIGELPDTEPEIKKAEGSSEPDRLGLLTSFNPQAGGVVVAGVQPGSVAEGAGLKEGDVILRIDGKKVGSLKQYAELTKQAKRYVSIGVKRGTQNLFFRFSLPE